ncbi:MAG: EI24 domain-containing protein [Myxococcota bacterium]
MHDLITGAKWPFVGLVFVVSRPRLYAWVVLPAILTVGLMIAAWYMAWASIPPMLNAVWPRPVPGPVQNLWNGSALFLIFWAFATGVLLLYSAIGILGSPFYDRLSQAVEAIVRPSSTPPFAWRTFLTDVWWSAVHSLMATVLWLGVLGLLVALSAIPVVGPLLELAASLLLTAGFIAREMMDGVMSRRRYRFVDKLALVWTHLPLMTGFGLAVTLLIAIPVVNFLAWPAAVVAGTLLFLDLEGDPHPGGRFP